MLLIISLYTQSRFDSLRGHTTVSLTILSLCRILAYYLLELWAQQEDLQNTAPTSSQIQLHKQSSSASYNSVEDEIMCQPSKRLISLGMQC